MTAVIDIASNTQYLPLQNDGECEVTELTELYGREDAAEAIGKAGITLKRWHADGKLVALGVGQRTYEDDPKEQAFSLIYTQRMVDEALAENFPVVPLAEEEESLMTTAEVAEFIGRSPRYVQLHSQEIDTLYEEGIYKRKPKTKKNPKVKNYEPIEPVMPCVLIGSTIIYLRKDVETHREELDRLEDEQGMVVVKNGRVGRYDLAKAVAGYMDKHQVTQTQFAQRSGLPRQYVGRILNRQDQPLRRPALLKVRGMLDGN